ncbi:MAG: hypothetical protein QE279_00425 [Rhodoferax sp.]|nr:hypothetical protein [Rhodoferax sp.]
MTARLLPVVLALVLGLLAIDNRSLWTDEIGTWELALPPTFSKWAAGFWLHYNSDGQLPLYHAYMWVWTEVFGTQEWVLRVANLPWLVLALAGLQRATAGKVQTPWLLTSFALNGFVWYYVNDARPYVLYVAGACWLMAGMLRLCRPDSTDVALAQGLRECLLGAVVLVGGSVLGVFWVASCLLVLGLLYPQVAKQVLYAACRQWWWVALTLLMGGAMLAVAVHSHISGARANQTAAFSVPGMGYGLIELLGATGLGPSRHDLRISVLQSNPAQLVLMALLAALSAWAVAASWWRLPTRRTRLAFAIAAGLPFVVMVILGLVLHWRVMGRHLSAVLPVVVLAHAVFLQHAAGQRSLGSRLVAGTLALGLLTSAVSNRLAPRHDKDDYRLAAAWAQQSLAAGRTVVWLADERALAYYGLAVPGIGYRDSVPLRLIPFSRYPKPGLNPAQLPDDIVFSPREGVDPGRRARPLLDTGQYKQVAKAAAFVHYQLAVPNGSTTRPSSP